jgi:GT2 family glycosyltransferase
LKNNNLIYAVVLNWNNWQTTLECVKSLLASQESDLEIIVVDNASEDDSIRKLQEQFPRISYIINQENYGFARGCNFGIKFALERGATHILLINNDVTVRENFLNDAIDCINNDANIFAVTGKIMMNSPVGYIWQAGGWIDMFRIQGVSRGFGKLDINQYDQVCDTQWASGAFSLFPSRTFKEIGLLPEEYFFGQEEWDYSRNITMSGKLIKYVPSFKCVHNAGNSYKKNHPVLLTYGCYLNKNIFARKYLGRFRYWFWRILFGAYVKYLWPSRAKNYVTDLYSLEDYVGAANRAISDFDNVQIVTRQVLINASKSLNISSSWRS